MSSTGRILMEQATTSRIQAKANRRSVLLKSAATLFAQRGFSGVSIEDLGAAAGVSGPAVYRHFSGKQALLGALLIGISEDLLAGGQAVLASTPDAEASLRALVAFHVDFALSQPDVIRVQDRDLDSLSDADRLQVRSLQRAYVELWVQVLGTMYPERKDAVRRLQAQAVFGLINSTPHSLRVHGRSADGPTAPSTARTVLESMAWAALTGS
ncbi:TetR family transcriptional regulator [Arthrobacter glacialis]|nr:TetR family transcriptional regulator [Arthrobacter glacialis]